ncbi:collagen-like protein [Vibrio parahaemolyticus]|nr:collagen-like protein [Vibrio parahaemolyticus]
MHWDETTSSYVVDEWGNFEDLTGPQGPQGIQGVQGVQGERGDDGSSFAVDEVGDYAELANYDDELKGFSFLAQDYITPPHTAPGTIFFKMSDTSGDWSDPIPFGKGPQGEQGEQGVQGIQGEQGPQGERGPDGEKGVQGDPGIQGIQGEKGDQGERGPQGEKGVQGDQGIQGVQGPVGEQGPTGEKGPTGDKGADGADGKSARGFVTVDDYLSTGTLENVISTTATVVLENDGYITVFAPIRVRTTKVGLFEGETGFGMDLVTTECRAKIEGGESIFLAAPAMVNIRSEAVHSGAIMETTVSGVSPLLSAGTYTVIVSLEVVGGTVADNEFQIVLQQATILASPA